MARTEEEILQSYQQSVELTDPTVDTTKGPLYDLVGRPLAQIVSPTEDDIETLEKIYSSEFAKTADEEQALAFITNWGESAGEGTPSLVRAHFMKFSRPRSDEIVPIPVGSIIANLGSTLQYVTVEAGNIIGSDADSYFNPVRRAYEVSVLAQAVANGPEYDVPAGIIRQVLSSVPGIDAVENRERAAGGTVAETLEQQITRVQTKLLGLAVNSANGTLTRIQSFSPTLIQDVKTVLPTDRILFRRLVKGPAADHYVLGSGMRTVTEIYISQLGGETLVPLRNVPVESISSVTLNNVAISNYSLVQDTSDETGGSTRAQDFLQLSVPLMAGDTVAIVLTFEGLLQDIQQNILSDAKLFNTDEMARKFKGVPINIEARGKALPTYEPEAVQQSVLDQLNILLTPGKWQQEFQPSFVEQEIRRLVTGLTGFTLTRFQRSTLAVSTIETVRLTDNEIAQYNTDFINITIKRT